MFQRPLQLSNKKEIVPVFFEACQLLNKFHLLQITNIVQKFREEKYLTQLYRKFSTLIQDKCGVPRGITKTCFSNLVREIFSFIHQW